MGYIVVFIIGLLFGSFGSVILHRLAGDITRVKVRSVLVGRSQCPHCTHTLARYDLFPLVSRLSTGGKCRYCNAKISHRYPLLELGSGLVFLGIFYRWTLFGGGDIGLLLIFLFLHWCLYLLMVHDIQTMYLHPAARRLLVAGVLFLLLHNTGSATDMTSLVSAAQRIIVFGLGFLAFYRLAKLYVRLRRKQHGEGLGQGDVMIAPVIGLVMRKTCVLYTGSMIFSWLEIVQIFRYYVIITCLASLLLLFVTPISKEGGKRLIPFFPGMIVGAWVVMIMSPRLLMIV